MARNYGLITATGINVDFATSTYNGGTAAIKTSSGQLFGIFVSDCGTLVINDSVSAAGGTIINSFAGGTSTMYDFGTPIDFTTGLSLSSTGSPKITVLYQ